MMKKMMGNGMPMMGMMRKMMGDSEDFNPMKMCKTMMSTMQKVSEIAFYATPEIRGMFEEWTESVESEIYQFISDKEKIDRKEIAGHFKISENAAQFFLNHLAASGRIKADFSDKVSDKDAGTETKKDTAKNPKSDTGRCNC